MTFQNDYSILFQPLPLRSLTLRNRIVAPPMVTKRDITGADGIEWYARLARGGVGLVIIEATPVNWFESKLSISSLHILADAVHKEGAAIAIQLFPVDFGSNVSPNNLTLLDIEKMKAHYAMSAKKCWKAGFDGVELHGAHGFILNQFFSPLKNLRRDTYGGGLKNRMKLGREIVLAIRNEVGYNLLVLYRHSPREDGGYTINDSIAFAKTLVKDGVDIMDVSPASDKGPADLSAPIKKAIDVPVIAVNDMDEPNRAAEALYKKRADLVAIGRGLIADPEWPRKVRERRIKEIVKCIKCNEKCHGNLSKGLPIECTQWVRF